MVKINDNTLAYEVLTSAYSSLWVAKATNKGYTIRLRVTRGGNRNDKNTWRIQVKVFAKGEKWAACHWFDIRHETLREAIDSAAENFKALDFAPDFKAIRKSGPRATKKAAVYYIKNTNAEVGEPTMVKTNAPLFTLEDCHEPQR